jgi:hypothetical protein
MAGGESFVDQVRASSPEAHQYVEVNRPGRRGYRVVAALVGIAYAAFGVLALVVTDDVAFSGERGHPFIGLTLNGATGILLLAAAVLVLAAALAPGNLGAVAMTGGAVLLLLVGLFFLAVFRTDVNVVAFTIIDVGAFWALAMIVFWCGMHAFEGERAPGHRSAFGADHTDYLETS